VPVPDDWAGQLAGEFEDPYWQHLRTFVTSERRSHQVFPAAPDVFAALRLTPFDQVRVVVLGQDPYHGPGQANGLCFSVSPGTPIPPSLRNIFAELGADLGCAPPATGDLSAWARQGVLLLNSTLTVRQGQAGSHQKQGWERFTDQIIRAVAARPQSTVFVLWGQSARTKRALIPTPPNRIVESPHPSPLSAHRGFFGSRPFSAVNEALVAAGQPPIDWCLSPV